MSEKWIRASDINTYVYCRRSWWLQRQEAVAPMNQDQLADGRHYHQQHGQLRRRSSAARRLAYVLLFVVVTIITFQVLITLGA
ncbi:MAG: hypothetical protein ACE5EY_12470 [Anaerolineae bacterium]